MTVPAYEPDRYIGNGSTDNYPFTFPVQDEDHLLVTVQDTDGNDSELVLGDSDDYTVELSGDGTGSITLVDGALTTDYLITIERATPRTQAASFAGQRTFYGAAHDAALDKQMMVAQEMQDDLDKSIKLSPHEDADDYSLILPLEADRADKVLAFDSEGNLTAITEVPEGSLSVSAFGETLLAAANGAAALELQGVSAYGAGLIAEADADGALDNLGFSAFFISIIGETTDGDVLTALGITDFGKELLDDPDASTAQTTLGISTFVKTTLDAADAAAFREVIGAAAGGVSGGDPSHTFQARLSLTTGTPVTTADVTAAGTIYLVPFRGNVIALFNGTTWENFYLSAQLSLALTATSGKNYDVFVYDNAGTPTLEILEWTNDTTRATALAYQDGVLCKTGELTRRYVGTFRASGANVTEDSRAKRFLWNYYNRVRRVMSVVEATNSWTYDGGSGVRQARATSSNQLAFVRGLAEDEVTARVLCTAVVTDGEGALVAIGADSTSAPAAECLFGAGGLNSTSSDSTLQLQAHYTSYNLGVGYHFLAWLEDTTASQTFYGDTHPEAGMTAQSGIFGELFA